jgi:fatty-acyl-CoA synthase
MGLIGNIVADAKFVRNVGRTILRASRVARNKTRTFPDAAEDLAKEFGDRVALLSDKETLTYAAYNARANQYARWAIDNGIRKGDVVCLMMLNRPEFLVVWLGITRVGGVVALLNTNLHGTPLAHSINIVEPKHIIVGSELLDAFATAAPLLTGSATAWRHGGSGGLPSVDQAILRYDSATLDPKDKPALTLEDRCLYIYTSGTTGMPKAANINHYRVLAGMNGFSGIMGATKDDRMYDCLPLYHTTGGVLAVGSTLTVGGSVYIREKFSASQFWDDVVANDCTLFQYIGELCRYLANAPPHPKERQHHLRLCCGNGLRPDVWVRFRDRFHIHEIREFYAATEGNAILFNPDNTVGAVGRIPKFAERMFPIKVVRYDVEREEVARDDDGRCIECAPDEVGEMVSKILIDPMRPGQRFEGYADKAATVRKILTDVFEPGDAWFRTGDLMRRDARGYYYFVDRIGDTFRWKAENVSTSEVAETINTAPGVVETTVYGVQIPETEGRAGMAAIVTGVGFDLEMLKRHVKEQLSPYAWPLFVRLRPALDATSTFKQRKVELVREGYDPTIIDEPLFFFDADKDAYVPLDAALHARIKAGQIRF